jgi:hypothetical protein
VIFAGSRADGGWRADSDLDVHIVHTGVWTQRRYRRASPETWFVPLEIVVDPLYVLYERALIDRAYATFYSSGRLAFPDDIPVELMPVVAAAQRFAATEHASAASASATASASALCPGSMKTTNLTRRG